MSPVGVEASSVGNLRSSRSVCQPLLAVPERGYRKQGVGGSPWEGVTWQVSYLFPVSECRRGNKRVRAVYAGVDMMAHTHNLSQPCRGWGGKNTSMKPGWAPQSDPSSSKHQNRYLKASLFHTKRNLHLSAWDITTLLKSKEKPPSPCLFYSFL